MESIGKKLKRLRVKMGITQEEVAKLINVRRETIGTWERGINIPQEICKDKLSEIFFQWETLIVMSDKL